VVEGIEAIVLRTVSDQPTLWDAILPSELLVLPAELARVDALLDDPVFFAPFAAYFDARVGRPSIPAKTYLRLMFLKFRYRLGYELLCREVADSISWQRFCRIPLGMRVPHPTTLMKITSRCGDDAVAALNEALLAKAAAGKLLRTDRVRADTTVVAADVGLRPIRVCWARRSARFVVAWRGSKPPAARRVLVPATGAVGGPTCPFVVFQAAGAHSPAARSGSGGCAADHRRGGDARGRRGHAQRPTLAARRHRGSQRSTGPSDQPPRHHDRPHSARGGAGPQPPGGGDARIGEPVGQFA
jgi:IS5 family transposase